MCSHEIWCDQKICSHAIPKCSHILVRTFFRANNFAPQKFPPLRRIQNFNEAVKCIQNFVIGKYAKFKHLFQFQIKCVMHLRQQLLESFSSVMGHVYDLYRSAQTLRFDLQEATVIAQSSWNFKKIWLIPSPR